MISSILEDRQQVVVTLFAVLAATLLAATGCRKTVDKPKDSAAAPAAPRKPAVLVGSVRVEPGHEEMPSFGVQEMERQVLAHVKAGIFPDVCAPPKKDDKTPVKLTPDGKLAGVMLAASEFNQLPAEMPPRVHNVAIRDCRLTPKLIVARLHDVLHIANETNYAMMPGLGSETFSQTMTVGQSRDIPLDTGGVRALLCGFNAPCGRTDVVVLTHEYAAVTDEKGEFRIDNFPAGETVRINAWHPLFFESMQNVRVEPGEEKRVELVLTPRPPAPPPVPFVKDPNQIYPD